MLYFAVQIAFIILLTVLNAQLEPEKRPSGVFWAFFTLFIISTLVLYSLAGFSDPGYVN